MLLLAVAIIWVLASYIVKSALDRGIGAFVFTYICNSLFILYLPLYYISAWCLRRRSQRSSASVGPDTGAEEWQQSRSYVCASAAASCAWAWPHRARVASRALGLAVLVCRAAHVQPEPEEDICCEQHDHQLLERCLYVYYLLLSSQRKRQRPKSRRGRAILRGHRPRGRALQTKNQGKRARCDFDFLVFLLLLLLLLLVLVEQALGDRRSNSDDQAETFWGDMLALISVILYSLYTVILKMTASPERKLAPSSSECCAKGHSIFTLSRWQPVSLEQAQTTPILRPTLLSFLPTHRSPPAGTTCEMGTEATGLTTRTSMQGTARALMLP